MKFQLLSCSVEVANRLATRFGRCKASRANRARQKMPHRERFGKSILQQIDRAGSQDEFTSTADVFRATFAVHP